MTTDLALEPLDVIRLYGYRFKIEVSFKSALHVIGAFLYHFWMRDMTPITRKARGQYLHCKTAAYRNAIRRKLDAYHRFIQLEIIAQGILLALGTTIPEIVWGLLRLMATHHPPRNRPFRSRHRPRPTQHPSPFSRR